MRVGYARVSTTKRAQDLSIEQQVLSLERAGCDRVLAERASAFTGKKRPAWEELWGLVATGTVTEVLVIDQSRLSRKGDDLEFLNACAVQGVRVRALTGGEIETDTVGGFVAAGVMSVVNQAQSRLIGAKVRDGLRRARASGRLATGRVPFGYAHLDGKAVPHPTDFALARARFEGLMANGMALSAWIRTSGEQVTRTGLRRWLDHPMLRGCVQGRWGAVEPLITFQEHEQAMRLLDARRGQRGRAPAQIHPFSGLVVCTGCDRCLSHQRDTTAATRTMRLKCKTIGCPLYGRSVREVIVRDCTIHHLRAAAGAMADLAAAAPPAESAELLELRHRLAQLRELADSGVPNLTEAIEHLSTQINTLRGVPSGPRRDYLARLLAVEGTLELATPAELRSLVIEFVASIRFTGNSRSVEVRLR